MFVTAVSRRNNVIWLQEKLILISKTISFNASGLSPNEYIIRTLFPQVGCMRQALGPGALGRPRGMERRGRWEGGSGWGTHVNPWLFHFNVWQNPLQLKQKQKQKKLCFLQTPFCPPEKRFYLVFIIIFHYLNINGLFSHSFLNADK